MAACFGVPVAVAVVNALVFVSDHGLGMVEVVQMDLCIRDSMHQNRRVNRAPMIRSMARNPPRVHRAGAEVPRLPTCELPVLRCSFTLVACKSIVYAGWRKTAGVSSLKHSFAATMVKP
jgi:hypothetical protein